MPQTTQVSKIYARVEDHEKDMVDLLSGLIKIPALGPKNGGPGESEKAGWLRKYCEKHGFKVEQYDAPDPSVPSGKRPNLVVRAKGKSSKRTLWIMSHIDVVPPGAEKDWTVTRPFEPKLVDGKLYGRGSEDNGQSLAASFWALKSLQEEGQTPTFDVALLFVADEETGSDLGLQWLIDTHPELFRKDDLILVPDGGDVKGEKIEVAEKTILWFKFIVTGKQCHGSMPYLGTNAHRAAAILTVLLDDELHKAFPDKDPLFVPPESTFEPTKHESNVPNINTIPGTETFYFDTRVIPKYKPEAVLKVVDACMRKVEKSNGVKVERVLEQNAPAAPPTSPDAEIVRRMKLALKDLRPKLKPVVYGVGGGTVAAIFRRKGFPAVVYGTYDELAHAPNEYAVVKNIVADAKLYAHLMTQPEQAPKA